MVALVALVAVVALVALVAVTTVVVKERFIHVCLKGGNRRGVG